MNFQQIVQQILPGCESRPAQVEMAEAVKFVMDEGGKLIVEAPTGTGKSFAYLIPAALRDFESRTVVATSNIALQEQLLLKDLPLVQKAFPSIRFALAKGKSNFLCRYRYRKNLDFVRRGIKRWAAKTQTGDMAELPFDPGVVWAKISATHEQCRGRKCPDYDDCYAVLARKSWDDSDILVVNYHLLAINMMFGGSFLPGFDHLVMDEGHNAADVFRQCLGARISKARLHRMSRKLDNISGHPLARVSGREITRLNGFFDKVLNFIDRSPNEVLAVAVPGCSEAADQLLGIISGLTVPEKDDEFGDFESMRRQCRSLASDLARCGEDMNKVSEVVSITDEKLEIRYLHVGDVLKKDMYPYIDSLTVTSATLAVDGTFEYVAEELGIEEAYPLILDSPFDPERVLIVKPEIQVKPNNERYPKIIPLAAKEVIRQTGGRALILCTSYKMLNAIGDALDMGHEVFVQGGGLQRSQMVEAFKEDKSSVILGTMSFWEGIDVPGDALVCVMMDKLPFPHFNDPVQIGLKRNGVDTFKDFSLPRAVIKMKQGLGRLIRRKDDYGVVVICDPRIDTAGYGAKFRRCLPPSPTTTDLGEISKFLRRFE